MLPLVIRVEELDTQTSSQVVLSHSPVHIGRNPLNELALKSRFVSQWHGIIKFDESSAFFTELGSTNGTEVDGRLVPKGEPVPLTPSTDLRIGDLRLHFSRAALEASPVERKQWTQFGMRAVKFDAPESPPAESPQVAEPPAPAEPLDALYAQYRNGYSALEAALERELTRVEVSQRPLLLKRWNTLFPELAREPGFASLLSRFGLSSSGSAGSSTVELSESLTGSTSELLRQFAKSYLPEVRALRTSVEVQEFFGRLAEVLETFASAFLELRRGQEQFGKEIAVRTTTAAGALSRARGVPEVLRYLLDWTATDSHRSQELMAGFVEVMLHQVALLNGIRGGVRGLLAQLSPGEIDRKLAATQVRFGPIKLAAGSWNRAGARWKLYLEQHQTFEEEQQLTTAVFGPEFARAYSTVMSDGTPR